MSKEVEDLVISAQALVDMYSHRLRPEEVVEAHVLDLAEKLEPFLSPPDPGLSKGD